MEAGVRARAGPDTAIVRQQQQVEQQQQQSTTTTTTVGPLQGDRKHEWMVFVFGVRVYLCAGRSERFQRSGDEGAKPARQREIK